MRTTDAAGARPKSREKPRTNKACSNCHLVPEYDYLRHGRCKACAQYFRTYTRERPYSVDGRKERCQRQPPAVAAFLRQQQARAEAGLRPLPVPAKYEPFIRAPVNPN